MLLDLCKQTGLRILNGRVGDDKGIGRYTFVGSSGSSFIVDYVITTQNLFSFVDTFVVNEPNILSDHCLINFSFTFNRKSTSHILTENISHNGISYKYVWNKNKIEQYNERLSNDVTRQKFSSFIEHVNCSTDKCDVNNCIEIFSHVLDDVVAPIFKRNVKQNCETDDSPLHCNNDWYTPDCDDKRRMFYRALNLYRCDRSENSRINMVHRRSEYKNCIRKAKFMYDHRGKDRS